VSGESCVDGGGPAKIPRSFRWMLIEMTWLGIPNGVNSSFEKHTLRGGFKVSARASLPLVLTAAGLSFFALHCSSDEGTLGGSAGSAGQPTSGSGSGGSAGQSYGGGGMSTGGSSGGVGTAGVATGGSSGAPVTLGGAGAGGSGTVAGAGGSSGAGGGASGSGGGSNVTFAQVKDVLAKSCMGGKCHSAASQHADWVTSDGLYMRLTTPLPQGTPHCVGSTPVVPGMPDKSLLVQIIKGQVMCSKAGGGMETIARMPDDCPGERMCLGDAQIKLITDWVTAGAPM
jgi:hypothetical protein